jgi:MFS family permease
MLWIELGLLAMAGAGFVRLSLAADIQGTSPIPLRAVVTPPQVTSRPDERHRAWGLVGCYGAFGFGYIVPATFLPTMARELVDDPWVFGLTWPLFGTAATVSVALAARWLASWPRRKVWALAQAIMAAGTLMPLLHQSLWAMALSAMLVGGTFMVATMAGLQLARDIMPHNPTPLLSRMTGAFATGQIAGPVLVRLISLSTIESSVALNWAHGIATLVLVITAAWLWQGAPAATEP